MKHSLDSAFRLLLWAAVYAIPALSVMAPIEDFDVWWHLRSADWIVEHGALPQTEPFSIFGEGKPYYAYSWLFELAVWLPYRCFGLTGILVFRALFVLLLLAIVHRFIAKRQPDFVPQIGLFALACVAFVPLMSERPWLFSILFYVLTLDAVLDLRDGKTTWTVWCLPLCFALWANSHIQFVYGLFLLVLACLAPLIDRYLVKQEGSWKPAPQLWLTAACFAATLLNPYHVQLYRVVLEYSRQTATYQIFPELKAFDFRQLPDWVVLGLTCAAAFVLGRRSRLSAFDVLLFASTAFFSFKSKRDLWFVVLTALMILAQTRFTAFRSDGFALTWPRRLVLAVVVVAVLLTAGWQRGLWGSELETKLEKTFPVEACAVIEKRGYEGKLFNHVDWGGYLIWRLGRKVSVDGRANLHGDRRVAHLHGVWEGRPGWDREPELTSARLVILQSRAPLASLLRLDCRFERVHEDDVAVVFIRNESPPPTEMKRSGDVQYSDPP